MNEEGKVTKEGNEANLWADVTPEMMSDEELDGNICIRHQPSYRSHPLNRPSTHPQLERRLGSPIPSGMKRWTVKKVATTNEINEGATSNTNEDTAAAEMREVEIETSDSDAMSDEY